MRNPTTSSPTGVLTILSVSPIEEDHQSLQTFIGQPSQTVLKTDRVRTASRLLKLHEVSVVFCERDLTPAETWIDMLEKIKGVSHPPSLVVTSRFADDLLWAEALNLGAWDVLAKPFDCIEVLRSLRSAWQHWIDQAHKYTMTKVVKAAS